MTKIKTSKKSKPKVAKLEILKRRIEAAFGLPDISSEISTREYVVARAIFYQLACKETSYNISDIARYVNKDHTVLIHARKQFPMYMEDFQQYKEIYFGLTGKLTQVYNADLVKANDRIFELELELDKVKGTAVDVSSLPISELLKTVPEHHLDTVLERLRAIIIMLPKTQPK